MGRDACYDRELGVLSHLSHPNIISLIGGCVHQDTERIIVYEFMPLRTLYDHLHGN
ncbi:serine/threonine-protein kinase pbs1 [Phtheirospermum japonicum]|uniref:Serine/threonine-protein kinase pbs1 n=1 Tax=Phtheirospermum japonicum TaxID=374723 RepID=A0A830BBU5_9LAMI|nr:serine/threonine-protein kinase pbs1 [Phtheirospermum japonicum]